jgi:arylsulfatase A-like enzyme
MDAARPNIILINCDDLGYGDLGCYGSTRNRTPAVDRMAAEGVRFTDFYMASPVCSPSRGAMMTGCYPNRIGFDLFDGLPVLFPGQSKGLNPEERTVAALLRARGYRTALIGKWHCGDQPPFLPTNHGFEYYFGLPYSNDMGRQARPGERNWIGRFEKALDVSYGNGDDPATWDYPPLPLMRGEEIIQQQPDQAALTERYVSECVSFIRDHKSEPFFLYFAQMYVHLPIYTPESFLKRSRNGRYGAAVEHVDWTVAVILDELKRQGLDRNTLVIFTSDNGSRVRGEGGSNDPLRGTKGTCWEGGQRLPMIARWPGRIPAGGTCGAVCTSMDFLPTFVKLAGGTVPTDRAIDGRDISALLQDPGAPSPHEAFYYFHAGNLHAVRKGEWKLHVCVGRDRELVDACELYNLADDIGETTDLADRHPEIVSELAARAEVIRRDLGDRRLGVEGSGRRPQGVHLPNKPLALYDPSYPYFAGEYDLADGG